MVLDQTHYKMLTTYFQASTSEFFQELTFQQLSIGFFASGAAEIPPCTTNGSILVSIVENNSQLVS